MLSSYPAQRPISLAPPVLPKEVPALPRGEDWAYEFLWGGERIRAVRREDSVHLLSRDGRDFTNRFPRIAAAIARFRARDVILDGEVIYLDAYGPSAINYLSRSLDEISTSRLALIVYDILCAHGRDIRHFPLLCRRLLLASIVQGTAVALSPLVTGEPELLISAAAKLGLRGVVAKRCGSAYRPNSLTSDWVKLTIGAESAPLTPSRPPFDVPVKLPQLPGNSRGSNRINPSPELGLGVG